VPSLQALLQQLPTLEQQVELLKGQGKAAFQQGVLSECQALYRRALEMAPDSAVLHCNQALVSAISFTTP
jgi:Flp pilus assembly protein TadD